jgi:hypothetical protein
LGLDHNVSSVKEVHISSSSKSGNNMHVFVDNISKVSVPFTGFWFTLPVLNINEIPLLVNLAVLFDHKDLSVLAI